MAEEEKKTPADSELKARFEDALEKGETLDPEAAKELLNEILQSPDEDQSTPTRCTLRG